MLKTGLAVTFTSFLISAAMAGCGEGGTIEPGDQDGSIGSGGGSGGKVAGSGGSSTDAGAADAADGGLGGKIDGGAGGKTDGGIGSGGAGGKTDGGAGSGGAGGAGSGGSGSGGAGAGDVSAPPSNVAAWVNESWSDQLDDNVKNRRVWLLDNVMKGKGQINLCVRWGASTAPSAAVKTGMAAAASKWFNDWFKAIGTYDCFPYGTGNVVAKVTGWAVKPGKESWVSDLGPDVKVYTQLDGSGEPKCPDACSFFEQANWGHTFPSCPGGEAFHTDYWMWLDDTIDGAAAVGGDWGLRMPVADFVAVLNGGGTADQLNTIEHEMGHGFGFQDYYDWTGARPTGGSIMIVGSTMSGTPTTADAWLARRTWKEMKVLRGW